MREIATALFEAATAGHLDSLDALLESGLVVDINYAHENEQTALLAAACHGCYGVIRSLCAAGADVNAQNTLGWTPLMLLSAAGSVESVKLLLSYDADVNMRNERGEDALHLATVHDHKNVAEVIKRYM